MALKVLGTMAVFFGMWPPALTAQTPNRSRSQGYVFIAPGVGDTGSGRQATLQFGAGGEGFIYRGLGIGVEITPVGPLPTNRYGSQYGLSWIDELVGAGSANLSYHLLPADTERKLEPFVTAGYTMFFRAGISQGSNFGGGINAWLNRKLAMRFEVRDQITWRRRNLGFRIGLTFR